MHRADFLPDHQSTAVFVKTAVFRNSYQKEPLK